MAGRVESEPRAILGLLRSREGYDRVRKVLVVKAPLEEAGKMWERVMRLQQSETSYRVTGLQDYRVTGLQG